MNKKERHHGSYIPFRCTSEVEDTIKRIAAERKESKSEVLRQLVDAGLVATGYKQNEDHLTELIQTAVTASMKPQVERLAAISAKATQISGAAFFMGIFASRLMLPPSEQQLVEEAAAQARKLGVEYLKLKDRDVDAFIAEGVVKVSED